MKKILILSVLSFCFLAKVSAQDDLLAGLEKEDSAKPKQNLTTATFKSTRVINMQSVELTGVGNLQFMISHKFGYIWDDAKGSQNFSNLFGLNSGYANTYLSFDYSPKWWLNLGAALANQGNYEGWAKFKLARQQTGIKQVPVSVVWLSLFRVDGNAGPSPDDLIWNRFSFLNQILVARKFNEELSLQFNGSLVHYNYIPYGYNNTNNIFTLGFSGRYKIAAKKAITFEYSHQLNGWKNQSDESGSIFNYVPDLFAIGYDWDTGGHIFQFYVSNTTESSNIKQLSANTGDWKKGNFAMGFTLNRSYAIKKIVNAAH